MNERNCGYRSEGDLKKDDEEKDESFKSDQTTEIYKRKGKTKGE